MDGSAARIAVRPHWLGVLEQVQSQLSDGRARAARLQAPAPAAAARALAGAHSGLLIALHGRATAPEQLVAELIEDAVQLIVAVAELWNTTRRSGEDKRVWLTEQLHHCLAAHEHAILAGELTYEVRSDDGQDPAARMRRALSGPANNEGISQLELASLRIAAVDLAALLVRAAANITVSGTAEGAPETGSPALEAGIRAVTSELATRARALDRPVNGRGDIVAHHLTAALRVPTGSETIDELEEAIDGGRIDTTALQNARAVWLRLATCEYIAVTALDSQLNTPTYEERFGNLDLAIQDAAVNVLTGARLITRASAFRHRRAWRHQTVGLSYALEAYVSGIRGHASSLAQTQLITLTRLARATAAITTLELTSPTLRSQVRP
jgi:hypothetical protein